MEHAGHRKRMRERFASQGLEGFHDHEKLELLLFYAIPQKNVNPLAHRLLEHFGSFHAVLEASCEELMKVEGMGEYAASFLTLVRQTALYLTKDREEKHKVISSRRQAQQHCLSLLSSFREEHFFVVCLDGQMRHLADAEIAQGSLTEVPAYPRKVAEAVIRYNAHAVVLCHNHPGGSCVPSAQDVEMTRVLGSMLSAMEVALADHIIVSGRETLSMVQCGLIEQLPTAVSMMPKVADSGLELRIRAKLEKENHQTKQRTDK